MKKFYFREVLADGLNENSQPVMKSGKVEYKKSR